MTTTELQPDWLSRCAIRAQVACRLSDLAAVAHEIKRLRHQLAEIERQVEVAELKEAHLRIRLAQHRADLAVLISRC